MTDKTAQKGFREREWIKKEVSYKPVSQTERVGTSPLSGGWGGVWRGTELRWLLGFLPLINVLMKFNLSNAGPRLSCARTAWREREGVRESEGVRGEEEIMGSRGAGETTCRNLGENKELRILCDTESSHVFLSGIGVSVMFRTVGSFDPTA